jgi:hypothetical protein
MAPKVCGGGREGTSLEGSGIPAVFVLFGDLR